MSDPLHLLELEERLSTDPQALYKEALLDRLLVISRRLSHQRRMLTSRERQAALLGAQLSVEAAVQVIRVISPHPAAATGANRCGGGPLRET